MVERTALRAGFHFVVPVWGAEYTQYFVELCLPTFLAPGNIPALPFLERHVFQIYTTPEDRAAIEASPSYRLLKQYIRVEFNRIRVPNPARNANRFSVQSDCYRRAIWKADAADQAMIFVTPDMIVADGSLRNLAQIADRPGVRAILGTGVRLVREVVRQQLSKDTYCSAAGDSITIVPRDLVRLMFATLHPIAKAHFLDNDCGEVILANLYWRAGPEGLVARCFYLHPFMVYPRVKNAQFTNSVDSDYVEAACPDPADAHVITDSEEFFVCEITPADRTQKGQRLSDPAAVLKWMSQWTTPRHRAQIGHFIHIHAGTTDVAQWHQAEARAQADVSVLLSALYQAGATAAGCGGGYIEAAGDSVPLWFFTALRSAREAQDFVDVALPSILAPANLPAQVDKSRYVYRIAASPSARPIIEQAEPFRELQAQISTTIDPRPESVMQADGFRSVFRREAIAAAEAAQAAAILIEPDMLLADNGFSFLRAVLRMKMRAILVPQLRLRRTTALPALRREHWIDGVVSIRQDDLVRFALDHLHPLARSQIQDDNCERVDPEAACWHVGAEGILMHAFDLYLLAVYPRGGPPAADCVDHPALGGLGLGAGEISIVRDSRAYAQCHLLDDDVTADMVPRGDAAVAKWAAAHTGTFQRLLFRNEIRLLATDKPSNRWQEVGALASAKALRVLHDLAHAVPRSRRA